MWKKTGIILGGIALIWIVMVIALMIIYNSTRKFEDLIQDKILSSLPDSSNVFLGKINGNLFSQIEIDSSYFQIDHSTAISFNKVKITHKLISYFSGIPQIKEIRIIKPQILLMKKEKKDSAVVLPKKFSLEETVIPFEKIFPENIHEVLQNTFKKIPSLQIDKIILDQLYIKKEGENLFTEGRIELKISPGLISLQKLRGNLLDRIPLKNISMDCKYDETSFLINNINFQTPNSTLKGKLDVEFEKRLNGLWIIDSLVINEEALKNIFPKSKKTFQNVNISSAGYIYFYPDSIYFDISPAGYFNEIHIDSSKISGKLGKTSLQIKEIKIWSPDGFLEGKMLTGFKLKTWLEINIRKFRLDKLIPAIDSSLINMNFKINFDKWDINSLNGKLAFNIYNSYVNNTQLKKIQLNVDAVKGNYTIDSTSGAYLTDESVFNLSGNFNGKLKGEIDLKFEEANFTRLGEVIGLEKLQGYGSGYFRFSGNLLDPDLSSYLLLDSLGYADLKGYGIEENIQIDNILGKRLGNYQLDILSGNVGPINITDAIIYLNIEHNKINLDSLTFYNFDNLLDIKGKVEIDTSSVTIALKKFEAMYQKIKMYNPDSLFLSFKNNELHFDKVYFETSTGGSIDARGFINFSDSLSNFAIDINKVNLKFLNQFELIPYKLSGIISFNGNLTKKLSNPDILFKGELNTLRLDTFNLGKISLNGKYLEKNIEVDKLNWKVENSEFSVFALFNVDSFLTGKKGNPEDIILVDFKDFELGNFKNLLGFNYPFAGKINSHITIKNTLLNLFAKGDISLSNFQYREYIVDSLSTLIDYENENVSLNDGVLNLYGTEFLFFAKTFLKYSIEKKTFSFFNEPLTAFLGGSAKSLDFLGDINKEVQNVRGDIQINIEVGGTVGKPLITAGSIDIEDGKLYLYKLANTINIKKLNANFEDGILYIDLPEAYARWQGKGKNFIYRFLNKVASVFTFWQKKENEGLIAVKGKIDLRRLAKPKLDLDVKMTHAYVNYFIENVEVVASTKNLKITGRDTIMVVGDITVDQGDYKLDLEKYEKNLLLQSGAREKPPYLSLNLNVDIPGNFYLTQDEPLNSFNFQIMGSVRVLKEPLQLIETSGILDIMEGELFLYSKQIKVISGKISFLNPKELPDMELLAELLQNPYRFEISERGKISSPTLDIKIYPIDGGEEITYDIKDKIAILITGLPFSEMSNIDLKETGMQAVTASAISFVQNKTKKYTGLDKIEMGNTQANRLNEGLQDESFFSFGKYLSNNLYFEYKTGMTGSGGIGAPKISWEPGNEVQMNYRLNRNWSFGTNYGLSFSGNRKIKFDFSWKLNF